MSERLTKKCFHDQYHKWCIEYEDKTLTVTSDINGEDYVIGKAIDKLAQLEDVLEKYGIDTAEELDGVLKPLIENGELENWKSAMFWKMQTEKLQKRWVKLKRYAQNYWSDCVLDKIQKLEKECEDEE